MELCIAYSVTYMLIRRKKPRQQGFISYIRTPSPPFFFMYTQKGVGHLKKKRFPSSYDDITIFCAIITLSPGEGGAHLVDRRVAINSGRMTPLNKVIRTQTDDGYYYVRPPKHHVQSKDMIKNIYTRWIDT